MTSLNDPATFLGVLNTLIAAAYLAELIDFPEVWDRWLDESLPKEVPARLDHSERRLFPFYEDLEKHVQKLQEEIAVL